MRFLGLFLLFISMTCWAGAQQISRTIYVNWRGGQDFVKIQDAVNSVPQNNNQWVQIKLAAGSYMEQVKVDRSYIYLKGQGQGLTLIDNSNATNLLESSTLAITADNFVAEDIGFKNNYNNPVTVDAGNPQKQAVAARVSADKVAFYRCSFMGLQDTLWDDSGRHYYHSCYIKGYMDFIFGMGQSQFQDCTLDINGDHLPGGDGFITKKLGFNLKRRKTKRHGFITAQGREKMSDTNGFVFLNCSTEGVGNVCLGRPWRPYARVLFYRSYLSANVLPQGWEARESDPKLLTFAESGCSGPGSDKSKRVPWEKKLSDGDINMLTSRSFIDSEGWIKRQPQRVFL